MSESEIHTLDTIKVPNGSSGASHGATDNEGNPNYSASSIIESDEEDQKRLDLPDMIVPTTASASVSREEARVSPNLETACQEGDLPLVKKLLTHDNLNTGALHHASAHNQWQVCKYLIERGADVNYRMEPLNATPLLWAARHGHAYIVKLLIDNGADPKVADSTGFTLLHLSVHSSNVLMVAYAVHLEIEVDKPDLGHRTPLHWAIVQGDHLSVEFLLKSGASPNIKDGEGALPLQLATYSSQSDQIVALLLQHGADPLEVPIDYANPPKAWTQGCKSAGRQPNGTVLKSRFISPEIAKFVTSVSPLVIIPFAMSLPRLTGSPWLGTALAILLVWQSKRVLERYVIPYCWKGDRAILQSTLIAAVFVSIFEAGTFYWFWNLSGIMLRDKPVSSLVLISLMLMVTLAYVVCMFMDPGKIEPKSMVTRLKGINELMDRGLFDSVHFCVHTSVVIPERARYDFYLDRVVARYDHYCPWVYNAVGVRNHRSFIVFIITLSIIIPLAGCQYAYYCRLQGGSAFGNMLCVVCLFQASWVYVLSIVQLSQIARGATTFEVANMNKLLLYKTDPIKAYSSLPRDHPKAQEILGDMSSAASLLKHSKCNGCAHKKKPVYPLWMRLTGFSQVKDAIDLMRHRRNVNRTDFGISQNCMDFWCTGGSFLRPDGARAALGGAPVDYSSLVGLPRHASTEVDQILA